MSLQEVRVTPALDYCFTLDTTAAQRSELVGDRIALLAQARRLGLPVRRAFCVSAPAFARITERLNPRDDSAGLQDTFWFEHLPKSVRRAVVQWGRGFRPMVVCASPLKGGLGGEFEVPPGKPDGVVVACGPQQLERAIVDIYKAAFVRGGGTLQVAVLLSPMVASQACGKALSNVPEGLDVGVHLAQVESDSQSVSQLLFAQDGAVLRGDSPAQGDTPGQGGSGLGRQELQRLSTLLRQAEELIGQPAAIDWLLADGQLWLTGIKRQPNNWHQLERLGAQAPDLELWSNFVLRENLSRPMSALSFGIWRDAFLPLVFETLTGLPRRATRERRMLPVDCISGRLYWSVNRLLATPGGSLLLRLAGIFDRGSGGEVLRQLEKNPLMPPPLHGLRKLWALSKSLLGVGGFLGRVILSVRTRQAFAYHKDFVEQRLVPRHNLASLSELQLVDLADQALQRSRACLRQALAHEFAGAIGLHLGVRLWSSLFDREISARPAGAIGQVVKRIDEIAALGRSCPDCFAADSTEGLLQGLAQTPDGEKIMEKWQQLMALHGFRCAGEFDLATERWWENPRPLLRAIRRSMAGGGEPAAAGERGKTFPWLQHLLHRLSWLREKPGWAFAAGLDELRRIYLEYGTRLVNRGLLQHRDEIMMLEPEEARDLLLGMRGDVEAVEEILRERSHSYRQQQQQAPPDGLRSDGVPVDGCGHLDSCSGTPVSGGVVTAVACVVQEPSTAAPLAGQVLVASVVTPGWAPLLVGAAALVAEFGDCGCHAATVARELGLPAVVGAIGAKRLIRTGDLLRVDASRGRVEILAKAEPV